MTDDEIWTKIYKFRSKYNDYASDYWILSNAKSSLSEGVNGLEALSSTQYQKVKDELTDALGELPELKEKLALTNCNLKTNAQSTVDIIDSAMTLIKDAMEDVQSNINYYYGKLD